MSRVVGIDLSLTATGVTILDDGIADVSLIRSKGSASASLKERAQRLSDLSARVLARLDFPDLIVIEQPAYSQTSGSHHDRSGLWWLLVGALILDGHKVAEVSPGVLKKYATGVGNASKDQVLAAVVKRYPDVDVTDNNTADSLVLAAMGARHLGEPIDDLPAKNLEALGKVRWAA